MDIEDVNIRMPQQTMDFKALRAKFQEEDLLLRQPRVKPNLPEKPKVVPPPTSPTHYLPAGARPSLLTSINQTLNGRSVMAPRVVFKDEKESEKPLKTTLLERNQGKLPTKASKEPLDENLLYHKLIKDKKPQPVTTADLVSAPYPSIVPNSKKKSFLGLRWPAKTNLDNVPTDPILDTPTLDGPVLAPLIPIPPEFDDEPNFSSLPDSDGVTSPPFFISDIPEPYLPSPESETPLEISILDHQGRISLVPSPKPIHHTISTPSPDFSSPMPSPSEPERGVTPVSIEAMLKNIDDSPSPLPAEGSRSALSALERADDIGQLRRNGAADQRVLSALQKIRRKSNLNLQTNSSVSSSPPPEDLHLPPSPTTLLAELPSLQTSRARRHSSKTGGQSSPTLEDTKKGGTEDIPMMLDSLPRNVDRANLEVAPKKPVKPSSIKTPNFEPPPPPTQHNAIPTASNLSEMPSANDFGDATSKTLAASQWGNGEHTGPDIPDGNTALYVNGIMLTGNQPTIGNQLPDHPRSFPVSTTVNSQATAGDQAHGIAYTGNSDHDVLSPKRRAKTEVGKKKKGPPKNPYAETMQDYNEGNKASLFGKRDKKVALAPEGPDHKELKKREKQRLEKEKKELKEKQEREKKELKEREKRENEIRKKFKITGSEEAMYRAKVTVTTKGRKDDLPVQKGEDISIIRTTNCPKGKWLARNFTNNYGYVAVDHVDLDIKEMLELGRNTSGTRVSSPVEADTGVSVPRSDSAMSPSGISNQYPQPSESFSDDSEEWTIDDDDAISPTDTAYPQAPLSKNRSMPDLGNADFNVSHHHSRHDLHAGGQAKNEALQKLATFFHAPKAEQPSASSTSEPETRFVFGSQRPIQQPHAMDFEYPDSLILPPPELYADDSE
ncbi:FYN-binding protein 1 isoform X1 [Syngnathus typhle]|uniref:FYN-binding protein 1 isoform X1 n=2 Tax=Syngnathus typhle TaxID=161592 RepID=UPI002A6A1FE8|nr:FYN-binding protein 1 isoform X1 [Syngnathus typhle]XP_061153753.1 FYN-binding protein 1 isoform X1 [Syngnathus typhle]